MACTENSNLTASRIMELRTKNHLTLEDVAKKVGVTRSTINKWEKGVISNMRKDKLLALANALGTTPAYLMGWVGKEGDLNHPMLTSETVSFPLLGEIAAGFDVVAVEDHWVGERFEIPRSYIHGDPNEYFVLRVKGDSMYPLYLNGDIVIIKKQPTVSHSGHVACVLYEGEYATLKKVHYDKAENSMTLEPINPSYMPKTIRGVDLEQCKILGVPVMQIRSL